MSTELLSREQILRDIETSPIYAQVVTITDDKKPISTGIYLNLPYECYLNAIIQEENGYKCIHGEGLGVSSMARKAGVASRLARGLAYIANMEDADSLTTHATSPHTIKILQSLIGSKTLKFEMPHYAEGTEGARQAISALTVDETQGIDVFTDIGDSYSPLLIGAERLLIFRMIEEL